MGLDLDLGKGTARRIARRGVVLHHPKKVFLARVGGKLLPVQVRKVLIADGQLGVEHLSENIE